jgi:hypothetical protein
MSSPDVAVAFGRRPPLAAGRAGWGCTQTAAATLVTPAPWQRRLGGNPIPAFPSRGEGVSHGSSLTLTLTLALAALALAPPTMAEESGTQLPLGASRRWPLVEPLGPSPSPWIALSGAYDMGVATDGEAAWTGVRVHIPVARHYGAVDIRLVGTYDDGGLDALGPELALRGVPLRLAGDRGVLGFSVSLFPRIEGEDPLMTVGGGLMGGYLGRRWFARAFLGAQGEVLQRRDGLDLMGSAAAGLILPHGLRPEVEVDVSWEVLRSGDVAVVVRPGLRYWPVEWLGIGLSADIWALGPGVETSAVRLDLVAHALE